MRISFIANILILTVSLELSSCLALFVAEAVVPGSVADLGLRRHFAGVTEEYREQFLQFAWDADLGWNHKPPFPAMDEINAAGFPWRASYDRDGSRHLDLPPMPLLAATYGDSFTHASEVNDDQTWQYDISRELGAEVKNFGVGGYGTGQALLYMQRHFREGRVAPITILTIYEKNAERVVNHFRPLYAPQGSAQLGFKPAFRRDENGRVRQWPNAYADETMTLEALREEAERLLDIDYWAARQARLQMPFSLNLVRVIRFQVEEFLRRCGDGQYGADSETRAVMRHIVGEFYKTATQAGSVPILLLIPDKKRLESGLSPGYISFRDEIENAYPGMPVVDVWRAEFDASRFFILPFKGHASVYGNQVIAGLLADGIRRLPVFSDIAQR